MLPSSYSKRRFSAGITASPCLGPVALGPRNWYGKYGGNTCHHYCRQVRLSNVLKTTRFVQRKLKSNTFTFIYAQRILHKVLLYTWVTVNSLVFTTHNLPMFCMPGWVSVSVGECEWVFVTWVMWHLQCCNNTTYALFCLLFMRYGTWVNIKLIIRMGMF